MRVKAVRVIGTSAFAIHVSMGNKAAIARPR